MAKKQQKPDEKFQLLITDIMGRITDYQLMSTDDEYFNKIEEFREYVSSFEYYYQYQNKGVIRPKK